MRRTAWVLLSLAAAACLGGQATDTRLDAHTIFHGGCLPLGELVPQIGKPVGVHLQADAATRDMLAYLNVKDRPLREVMSQIAKAFDLTWTRSGKEAKPSYTLEQTLSQKRRYEALVHKATYERIAVARKNLRRYVNALEVPEADRDKVVAEWEKEKQRDLSKGEPDGYVYELLKARWMRMAVRLAASLTDNDWQKVIDDGSLVFSTSPTSAQRRLDPGYLEEGVAWQADIKSARADPSKQMAWVGEIAPYGPATETETRSMNPANAAILKIRFTDDGKAMTQVCAELQDKSRKPLVRNMGWPVSGWVLPSDTGDKKPYGADALFQRPYEPPERLLGLTRDDIQKRYRQWVGTHAADEFLDPLDLVVTPLLDDVAAKLGVSMVIPLCDKLVRAPVQKSKTLAQLLDGWEYQGYCLSFHVTDAWLTATRFDGPGSVAYADTCPRRVLRKLCKELHGTALPSVDDLGEAAMGVSDEQWSGACNLLTAMYPMLGMGNLARDGVPEVLRIWSSLGPDQKAKTREDTGLRCAAGVLGPEQRGELFWWVRRDMPWAQDWTDEFPNGLPADTSLRFAVNERISGFVESAPSGAEPAQDILGNVVDMTFPLTPLDLYENYVRSHRAQGVLYPGAGWDMDVTLLWPYAPGQGVPADIAISRFCGFRAARATSDRAADSNNPDEALSKAIAEGKRASEKGK